MPPEKTEQRRISYLGRLAQLNHRTLALLMTTIFVATLLVVWMISSGAVVGDRIFGIGVMFSILALAWADNLLETLGKVRPWRELAAHTGLTCQVGGFLIGYAVQVVGTYRQRPLTLYTPKKGKGRSS